MIRKILFLFCLFLITFNESSFAIASRNLTIFTEPNMSVALTELARVYSQKNNVIVAVNFNATSDLISDIDAGEPADIFISAHSGLIESLRQKGLIDVYNIGYIAQDEIVLTAPSSATIFKELLDDNLSFEKKLSFLNQSKATIICDNKNSSSGKVVSDLLSDYNFSDLKLFYKLNEDRTPILSLIKSEKNQYGLLLASQVNNDKDFLIIARNKDRNIFYQALVIAGDNMEAAREFMRFLKSGTAKKIFKINGFIVE